MATAGDGDKVRVHYTGTLEDGSQFDSSRGREPLEVTLGKGEVIPGFETALQGMSPGETKKVTVPAQDAYGERNEEQVHEVPKSALPDNLTVEIGDRLQVRQPDQSDVVVTVVSQDDDSVTLDANHPLAGRALTFEIEMVEIV